MGHIAQAAMVLTVFAGISKISGFFREMTVAAIFGVSPEVDAFLVAAVMAIIRALCSLVKFSARTMYTLLRTKRGSRLAKTRSGVGSRM